MPNQDNNQKSPQKGGAQPKTDDNFANEQRQGQGNSKKPDQQDRQNMRDADPRGNRNQGQEQSVSGQQQDRARVAETGQAERDVDALKGDGADEGMEDNERIAQRGPQQGGPAQKQHKDR